MNSKWGKTHPNKLDQRVIDVGSFRQKETATRTQVMEEKQVLLLERQKRRERESVCKTLKVRETIILEVRNQKEYIGGCKGKELEV